MMLTHSEVENQSRWPNPCYNRCIEVVFCSSGFCKIPEFLILMQPSVMIVMFQMEILTFYEYLPCNAIMPVMDLAH